MDKTITLEIKNASLGYYHQPVLRDIDLRAAPGEIVGLIGPNGSGKSTIIKALSRIIRPYTGSVIVNRRDIATIPRQEMARLVGVVPQLPLLPSAFTAFDIVLMGRNPHLKLFQAEGRRDYEMAQEAMRQTNTTSLADRQVNELSGGEIQCLMIARVLVQETGAILLDEPTANLDIGRQAEILDLIKRLCREKQLTVLAALHDLNLAAQYCDRLCLINRGRVHAQGKPAEVITEANIRQVYGAAGCVYTHPVNGLPTVLLRANNKTGTSDVE